MQGLPRDLRRSTPRIGDPEAEKGARPRSRPLNEYVVAVLPGRERLERPATAAPAHAGFARAVQEVPARERVGALDGHVARVAGDVCLGLLAGDDRRVEAPRRLPSIADERGKRRAAQASGIRKRNTARMLSAHAHAEHVPVDRLRLG